MLEWNISQFYWKIFIVFDMFLKKMARFIQFFGKKHHGSKFKSSADFFKPKRVRKYTKNTLGEWVYFLLQLIPKIKEERDKSKKM